MVLTIVSFAYATESSAGLPELLFSNSGKNLFMDYSNCRQYWKLNYIWPTHFWNRFNSCWYSCSNLGKCVFYVFHPPDNRFIKQKLQKNSASWKSLCSLYCYIWLMQQELSQNESPEMFLLFSIAFLYYWFVRFEFIKR